MPYQVTRTDTGQFVLIDPATETVVIDDDLVAGFSKLDKILADKPRAPGVRPTNQSSEFGFRGGPRYTPILLAIVLPFVWLLALYLMLNHLLSQHSLTLEQAKDGKAELDKLGHELQALRSEIAGTQRSAKTKPAKANKAKPVEPVEAVPPPEDTDAAAPIDRPSTAVAPAKPKPADGDASKSPTGGPN
jgi:hypothetical protein